MGRIRTIKPEFPQSESVGRLSRDARLLFVNLLTVVDDSGRARGASRLLASLLYPYDVDAPARIDGWLAELDRECMVARYIHDGAIFLEMLNFQKHQKIDKPTPSKLPPFDASSRILAESSRILGDGSGSGSVSGEDLDRIRACRPLSPCGDVQQHHLDVRIQGGGGDLALTSDATETPARRRAAVPRGKILAAWADICPMLPQPAIPTASRETRLRTFWERCQRDAAAKGMDPLEWVRGLFQMVADSDFLTGRKGRSHGHENFTVDLWWVIQPEKYAYILEGRYDNRRHVG